MSVPIVAGLREGSLVNLQYFLNASAEIVKEELTSSDVGTIGHVKPGSIGQCSPCVFVYSPKIIDYAIISILFHATATNHMI